MSTIKSRASRDRIWHWGAVITLGLTGAVCLCYLMIFFKPGLVGGFLSTAKPTPTVAQVMSLSTFTPGPTRTATPVSTQTHMPSATSSPSEIPTRTPTLDRTPGPTPTFPPTWTPASPPGSPVPTRSNYPFALQNNEVIYTEYFFGAGCDWLGIAGLALDKEGNPIARMPIVLNGGGFQNRVTYSGDAPAYGESGWEHYLDNKVKEGDFTIQLYNNQGEPVSDLIQVPTRADCRANLIMIIFELNWDEYTP